MNKSNCSHTCLKSKILRAAAIALLFLLFLICLTPAFIKLVFLDLPERTTHYDCDDAVLFMYDKLSRFPIKVTPVVGDLNTTGEKYEDITHIWLMVDIAGLKIPLDWGSLLIDRQHYEGYTVDYAQLVAFVEQDKNASGTNTAIASVLSSPLLKP
jgi:hypothetical protein